MKILINLILRSLSTERHKIFALLFLTTLCFSIDSNAQRTCGADEYHQELMNSPEYAKRYKEARKTALQNLGKYNTGTSSLRIPVAIHFSDEVSTQNMCCLIEASRAQIDVINQDFNARNEDITDFIDISNACSSQFPLSALHDGLNIEFYIATSNHPNNSGLNDGEYAITIGQESWPNAGSEWAGYLNIFVGLHRLKM